MLREVYSTQAAKNRVQKCRLRHMSPEELALRHVRTFRKDPRRHAAPAHGQRRLLPFTRPAGPYLAGAPGLCGPRAPALPPRPPHAASAEWRAEPPRSRSRSRPPVRTGLPGDAGQGQGLRGPPRPCARPHWKEGAEKGLRTHPRPAEYGTVLPDHGMIFSGRTIGRAPPCAQEEHPGSGSRGLEACRLSKHASSRAAAPSRG